MELSNRYKSFDRDTPKSQAGNGAADPNTETEKTRTTITVEQAVEQIGFGRFQIKLSFLAGLAWIADSMEIMVISILGPTLICDWKISRLEEALISTVVFTGYFIGSPYFGFLADTHGRKVNLIYGSIWASYFGILSSLSPNIIWLLVLRSILGFGIASAPQAITLYAEFLPMKSRGKCIVLVEVFWAIGAALEAILALLLMNRFGWRVWLGVSSSPLIIFAIICSWWLPESPRYDVAMGNNTRARKTLERMAQDNQVAMPEGLLVSEKQEEVARCKDLFAPEYRRTSVLLWIIWFVSSLCYYGVTLMTTEYIKAGTTCPATEMGTNLFSSETCVACKKLTERDYSELIWTSMAELPGLVLTVVLIDSIGRRPSLALLFAFYALTCGLLYICMGRVPMVVLLFCSRALITASFQATYVYTAEVYPTVIRALGLGCGSAAARIGAITTPFVAQVLLNISHLMALSVYGAAGVVALVSSVLLKIETKGRVMKTGMH